MSAFNTILQLTEDNKTQEEREITKVEELLNKIKKEAENDNNS